LTVTLRPFFFFGVCPVFSPLPFCDHFSFTPPSFLVFQADPPCRSFFPCQSVSVSCTRVSYYLLFLRFWFLSFSLLFLSLLFCPIIFSITKDMPVRRRAQVCVQFLCIFLRCAVRLTSVVPLPFTGLFFPAPLPWTDGFSVSYVISFPFYLICSCGTVIIIVCRRFFCRLNFSPLVMFSRSVPMGELTLSVYFFQL